MNAGEEMLDSFRLANERQRKIEELETALQAERCHLADAYEQLDAMEAELAQERAQRAIVERRLPWSVAAEERATHVETVRRLEDERAAHEVTKAELARVSADASATKARLRRCEVAFAQSEEMLNEMDNLITSYVGEGGGALLVERLRWAFGVLAQSKGGAA